MTECAATDCQYWAGAVYCADDCPGTLAARVDSFPARPGLPRGSLRAWPQLMIPVSHAALSIQPMRENPHGR